MNITDKHSAGRCRCCMVPGTATKDLSSEYEWMGEKEVYVDMLIESFDIKLERDQTAGWSICEKCITRLRDSSNFKKQVLFSEKCLLQRVSDDGNGDMSVLEPKPSVMMKCEMDIDGGDKADDGFDYQDDVLNVDTKEVSVKFEPMPSTSEVSNDEDVPLSSLSAAFKRKAPVKTVAAPAAKWPKLTIRSLQPKEKSRPAFAPKFTVSKKIARLQVKTSLKNKSTPVAMAASKGVVFFREILKSRGPKAKHFATAVLTHTNAVPFVTHRRKLIKCIYSCFEELDPCSLRTHTIAKHQKSLIRAARGIPRSVLRVDITELQCTMCSQPIQDLTALREHFTSEHKLNIYTNTADVLVPYKLATGPMNCQSCDAVFEGLDNLDAHMETHYPLHTCESCGRGFMEEKKLKSHAMMHADKNFVCPECDAPFVTETLRRRHVNSIHRGIGLWKCFICPGDVRFKSHDKKMDHMAILHGVLKPPTPMCPECKKTFKNQCTMRKHVRMVHEGVGLNKCRDCDSVFAKKSDLDGHVRLRHTGESLPCVHCGRTYHSVKELSKHMKSHHEALERRCPCMRCGLPCGNRYKLKHHMIDKHSEYN